MNKKNEIDKFLQMLYRNSKNQEINDDIVYQFLMFNTIKKNEMDNFVYEGINVSPLFKIWQNNLGNKPNSLAGTTKSKRFWFFASKQKIDSDSFIKLYIPLDFEHLEKGVNLLFEFLDKENIIHSSEVSRMMRADNVIIRIRKDDIEALEKIINFIYNNPFFKNAFNKVNPFVPSYNNIGIMEEHGNSYNGDISYYIADYINEAKKEKKDKVSADDFYEYLKKCSSKSVVFDYALLKTYFEAYNDTNIIENNKKSNEEVFSIEKKYSMFVDAIKNTYRNYGLEQAIYSIIKILSDRNYNYISNKGLKYNIRDMIKNNISNDEIIYFINDHLKVEDIFNSNLTITDKVSIFINSIIKNNLSYEFDEICTVTLDKYNSDVLRNAIYKFVFQDSIKGFSRYKKGSKINYREKMLHYDKRQLYFIIKESLLNKGINIEFPNYNELIDMYVLELEKNRNNINEKSL